MSLRSLAGRTSSRLRTVTSGRRGTAQLGLVLAAAAVAGGMTLGSGVAAQNAKSGYDLAWLTDSARGQLVQVDPVLGRPNVRLQVADPNSALSIQQGNGQLVVIDRKTGKITSIDLGTLLVGGARTARPGNEVKVLLAGPRLYVADLARGTVQAVDPATQASIGTPWSAGGPLVDIGVDGTHAVWALDAAKHLVNLRWDDGTSTLSTVSSRAVQGAGAGSVIVGHDRGITLVGSRGAIVRIGTGSDARLDAPRVRGPLHGPQTSPDVLVPVSDPGTSSVVIVGESGAIVDDVSGLGCERPAAPTVFDGRIYVPCTGANKVLVLDPSGKQVGAAIPTPDGGDPQLTVSGGHLVIDVPGAGRATVVDASGGRRDFPTEAPGVGVQNPTQPPPDPPAPPSPKPSHPRGNSDGHNGGRGDTPTGGGRGDNPGSGAPSSDAPSSPASPPTSQGSAQASARGDGTVLVTWDAPSGGGSTTVTATATGAIVATVPPGAASATVTVLDPGTTTAFVVHNARLDATTNSVTTTTAPGAVSGVTVTSQGVSNGVATLAVAWSAASANGARTSYTVSQEGGSASTVTASLHATLAVPCASTCSGTISVTARNAAGTGAVATGTYSITGAAPQPQPSQPAPQPQPQPSAPQPQPQPSTPPAQVMPAAGQQLITYSKTAGSDNTGNPATVTLTINAPSDWQSFTGTCSLSEDGAQVESIPCTATGYTHTFEYYESGSHSYVVTAHGTSQSVDSATATVPVIYRVICGNAVGARSLTTAGGTGPLRLPQCTQPPCSGCSIPFLQLPAADTVAATLPREVRVVASYLMPIARRIL